MTRTASTATPVGVAHAFKDQSLLHTALTHASAADGRPTLSVNQRLEFLGDRVLGLIVADWLYAAHASEDESALSRRLNAVVNRAACARAARRAGLGPALVLSAAEERNGGRDKDTILADACEAVIAALYLDGGYEAARAFVESHFADEFAPRAAPPRDPKNRLQEWAAAQGLAPPAYRLINREGPDHAPLFLVGVSVTGLGDGQGRAASKREAERAAAEDLLDRAGLDE
jgi:ribonuclease-3